MNGSAAFRHAYVTLSSQRARLVTPQVGRFFIAPGRFVGVASTQEKPRGWQVNSKLEVLDTSSRERRIVTKPPGNWSWVTQTWANTMYESRGPKLLRVLSLSYPPPHHLGYDEERRGQSETGQYRPSTVRSRGAESIAKIADPRQRPRGSTNVLPTHQERRPQT